MGLLCAHTAGMHEVPGQGSSRGDNLLVYIVVFPSREVRSLCKYEVECRN